MSRTAGKSAVFIMADDKARFRYGNGWDLMHNAAKQAAVAFEVMAITANQDEQVSAERVRAIINEAYSEIIDAYPVY